METGIDRGLVAGLAGRCDRKRIVQELQGAPCRLFPVTLLEGFRLLEKSLTPGRPGNHQVPEMRAERRHEMQRVESLRKDAVEGHKRRPILPPEEVLRKGEAVLVIQDVEIPDYVLIMDIRAAEGNGLIEDREGIAHCAVRLLCDFVERLIIDRDALLLRYAAKVMDHIAYGDTVEIVSLAAGEDGREYLVFFGGGKYEYSV